MENQKTIKKEIEVKGKGIHTGNPVTLKFKPAGPHIGILFKRTDISNSPIIKADIDYVLDGNKSPRHTSLGLGGIEVHTIEHVMAALFGLKIDNIIMELDNCEVPALDGSAASFTNILKEAGIQDLDSKRKNYVLREA